ncbi:MAG: carbohydrate kinase [Thalassovita sp.]
MRSSKGILCAGRVYCDLVFTDVPSLPVMNTEVFADGLSLHAGGGAFITAAAFRALGQPASLLAYLPAAPFEEATRADLLAAGVDDGLCAQMGAGMAPQITVVMTGGEDRAFLSHKSGAAMPQADLPSGQWHHLHIGELRSLMEHPDLIAKARDAGMTISVDCGWDDALLAQGSALNDVLSQIDVFLPNEAEYDALCASGLANAAKLVVVKCGAKGARALTEGTWVQQDALPTAVVDATGAGDAFNGGFLTAWLEGRQVKDCLSLGNRCGAAAVSQAGGIAGLKRLSATLVQGS